MATLQDNLFSSRTDLAVFRDISQNITDEKVAQFIREAQTIEIRQFLGKTLYAKMQSDWVDANGTFSDAVYVSLWFGTEYANTDGDTIRFNGLINASVYFTYARFIKQQQTNVSRFGVESLQSDISEDQTAGTVRTKANEAKDMAMQYLADAKDFICANETDYPDYPVSNSNRRTSFDFFKV